LISRLQFAQKKPGTDKGAGARQPASSVFQRIPALLDELREYADHYISAKKDLTRAKARQLTIKAILLSLALAAGLAAVFVSVLLLLTGLALGLSELFGDRYWLGFLVTGILLLGIMGAAAWFGLQRWNKSARETTIKRYEQRHDLQLRRYQRSVSQPCSGTQPAVPPPPAEQREPIR
jgi:CHASE3 domain sensor protein